jgi:hypothetical protein
MGACVVTMHERVEKISSGGVGMNMDFGPYTDP